MFSLAFRSGLHLSAGTHLFERILSTPKLTLLQTSEMWRGKSGEWTRMADERSNITVFRSVEQIAARTLCEQPLANMPPDRVV
jgi:hypothetical protein